MKQCDICTKTTSDVLLGKNAEKRYELILEGSSFVLPLHLYICSKCRKKLIKYIKYERARASERKQK